MPEPNKGCLCTRKSFIVKCSVDSSMTSKSFRIFDPVFPESLVYDSWFSEFASAFQKQAVRRLDTAWSK